MELTDSKKEVLADLVSKLDELEQLWGADCDVDDALCYLFGLRERVRMVFLGG